MTELVCILWTHSMHIAGSITHTMSESTNNMHQTSEQHKELGESRKKQDHDDQIKINNVIEQFNPFNIERSELQSLTTGVTADEKGEL